MRQEVSLRHEARNVADFVKWAKSAVYGDYCVYHSGNLSIDRRENDDVCKLADTVLLLHDTGFVIATQHRRNIGAQTDYMATRTGRGYAPRSIMNGEISAGDWRILEAINGARHGKSITRVIRDTLATSSEAAARAVLDSLKIRGWIEEDPSVLGWKISRLGLSMLV